MNQDPAEIRKQIERTRERLGETADAIRYKIDVPNRIRDRIGAVAPIANKPLMLAAGASVLGLLAGVTAPMIPMERKLFRWVRRRLPF
ncbi:MAG: DUF3618 domain-containing protein [Vulcanimicrobiaceae bacterium]